MGQPRAEAGSSKRVRRPPHPQIQEQEVGPDLALVFGQQGHPAAPAEQASLQHGSQHQSPSCSETAHGEMMYRGPSLRGDHGHQSPTWRRVQRTGKKLR